MHRETEIRSLPGMTGKSHQRQLAFDIDELLILQLVEDFIPDDSSALLW
jgi:hypothetical protein